MITVQGLFRRADRQTVLEFTLAERACDRKAEWDCVFLYAAAFETVRACQPEPNKDNMVVLVEFAGEGLCDKYPGVRYEDRDYEVYHAICGADDWTRGEGDGQTWGLEFGSLEAWAGYSVEKSEVERIGVNKLAALILWEMTYHGFTSEAIREVVEERSQQVTEIATGDGKGGDPR